MESVNPSFVTAATSTTELLETEHNVTEGTWGKDFCPLAMPRAQVWGNFTGTSQLTWSFPPFLEIWGWPDQCLMHRAACDSPLSLSWPGLPQNMGWGLV